MSRPNQPQADRPLEHISPNDLVVYGNNPRTHPPSQIEKLKKSYQEYGFTNPILIDESNVIIAGDARHQMARALGLDVVPCIRISDLSDTQKRALRIADNRISLDAGWDDEKLREEIQRLSSDGFDMEAIGMDSDELAMLLRDVSGNDPDEAPPAPDNPVSVLGDVWILGDHRIVCGDSTAPLYVERCLAGRKPHLMVTDPPYGVNYKPQWRSEVLKDGNNRASGVVVGDDRADWSEVWKLFPGNVCYVWHSMLHAGEVFNSLNDSGFTVRAEIVWVKTRPVLSKGAYKHGAYHPQHESAWFAERSVRKSPAYALLDEALARIEAGMPLDEDWTQKVAQITSPHGGFEPEHESASYAVRRGSRQDWTGDTKQTTVWNIDHIRSGTGHGTQKPVECMRRPIENNSKPRDAVFEPFSGSGTTIIACEMLVRHCRAIEINPAYVDVAVIRWENFTNRKAVHEESGLTIEELAQERGVPMPERVALVEKKG